MSLGLTLIAAMDQNRLIGHGDELPWKLPADLRHFRRHTTGKPILMGRKTYESIGRPLPKRRNLILTRRVGWQAEGTEVFHSLEDACDAVRSENELMVIGGAHVYGAMLPKSDRMLLTIIHARFSGDVFFPQFEPADWLIADREDHQPDETNQYAYSFLELRRTGTGLPLPTNFPLGL